MLKVNMFKMVCYVCGPVMALEALVKIILDF